MKLQRLIPLLSRPALDASRTYGERILSLSPIVYWPLNEASGTAAQELIANLDGTYTGVDLAQTQAPFTCPYFDGANDYCNIYSAGLNTAWDRSENSIAIWVKPNFSWTDGTSRRSVQMFTSANQEGYSLAKGSANNTYALQSFIGGLMKAVTLTSQSWTTWKHIALTVSKTADEVKAYMNGAQVGTTQTGLGTSSTNGLSSSTCFIGAASATPANVWDGWLAHLAIWSRPLTPTEVANLYNWGR